jgi:hypothetical protein
VFAADFHPDASLYPAARPPQRPTVQAFVARMQYLAATRLRSFEEAVLGSQVHVFGNVAVALAACEMTENGRDPNRGVEALLLIKTRRRGASWRRRGIRRAKPDQFRRISFGGKAKGRRGQGAARPRGGEAKE